ncbi:MAG: hypothetical protein R2747_08280 [Pyrinomonadaceae bacterium]
MSKVLTLLAGVIIGLILGGIFTFYYFIGAPQAAQVPGQPIQPPEQGGIPAGTAQVVLNQQFFNNVLEIIFRDMNAPSFPLNLSQERADYQIKPEKIAFFENEKTCDGRITLLPEGSGVKTSVQLENGKINVPLAFKGNASVLGNCIQFSGWAKGVFTLNYDAEQKNVYGKINVETVNLDGVTPLAGGLIAQFVQNSLNQKVNPITILKGKQISLSLPVSATDGTLNAQIKDVRAEIKETDLSLFVIYDFSGTKGIQPAQ